MRTPVNIQSELDRHRAVNAARVKLLLDTQYDIEVTRSFDLDFTSATEDEATGLSRLLFAKGMTLLTAEPEFRSSGVWSTRVSVKRSLREITAEEYICDLITLASGVHSCFAGWEMLADGAAEETQPHPDPSDSQVTTE